MCRLQICSTFLFILESLEAYMDGPVKTKPGSHKWHLEQNSLGPVDFYLEGKSLDLSSILSL